MKEGQKPKKVESSEFVDDVQDPLIKKSIVEEPAKPKVE